MLRASATTFRQLGTGLISKRHEVQTQWTYDLWANDWIYDKFKSQEFQSVSWKGGLVCGCLPGKTENPAALLSLYSVHIDRLSIFIINNLPAVNKVSSPQGQTFAKHS